MNAKLTLQNGDPIPALGLGTWKSKPGEVYEAVREAIRVGYRHIDCAAVYGNETEVGQAFTDAFSAGDVKREELWITSKLWNAYHHPDDVQGALEKTLSDLKLDALDLYLIHWPIAFKRGLAGMPQSAEDLISPEELPIERTFEAMLKVRDAGLTRFSGVSNFSLSKVTRCKKALGEAPAMNQVEMHPYLQQKDLVEGCKGLGTEMTAYSPLGSPDSASMFGRTDEDPLLKNATIAKIAEKHGASNGQVLIAWALCRGTFTIPKSTNPKRIAENFGAKDVKLDAVDMETIAAMDKHQRQLNGAGFCLGSGYTVESLWDE